MGGTSTAQSQPTVSHPLLRTPLIGGRVGKQEALERASLGSNPSAATARSQTSALSTPLRLGVWAGRLPSPRVQETTRLELCPSQTDRGERTWTFAEMS